MARDLFIGGAWIAGAGTPFHATDPATGAPGPQTRAASTAQVDAAIAAAQTAFASWRATKLSDRIAYARGFAKAIDVRADGLARAISAEMGKPLWDARTEVAAVIGKIELSIRAQSMRAGEFREPSAFGAVGLRHNPHGVMAVFGPFNFPAHLPNGHIAPALLAGDTVVFKPSELAPSAGRIMAEAWEEARLPSGVFNLVQGGRETGAALLDAPDVAGVLFTGSASTGAAIYRRFAGRPDVLLALEMGGNNALIVWPPANPAACANLIAHSAFLTTGQRCSCARRLIVPADEFGDQVLSALVDVARNLSVGAWNADPAPFMGPLVSAGAATAAAAAEQGLIDLGGRSLASLCPEGAFVRPALIDMTDARAAPDEEIFAPLVQIFRVRTFDEALARANDTRFGLAAGLLSDDEALWTRAQTDLRAGVLNWNRPTTGASGALPFGGPGLSGNLRPSAAYAADYVAYPVAMQIAATQTPIAAPGLP